MTAVELLTPVEATPANPEWHELRRAGISASEIAAVLGISPWESPFSLYHRKANGWRVDLSAEMEWGTRLEGAVAEKFGDEHVDHIALRRAGLYAHKERPYQLATPDRLIHDACPDCDGRGSSGPASGPETNGLCASCLGSGLGSPPLAVLECKTAHNRDEWGEPGTDDIPVHYRAQVLWQLDVLGLDVGHVPVLISGVDYREYVIRRDDKDLRVMRAAGAQFMERLANDDPPDLDGHAATISTLKALHPTMDKAEEVDAEPDFAEGYRRARQLKSRAEKLLDRYEARAREQLGVGNAGRLVCNGHLVCSRSVYDRVGYTVEPTTIDKLNPGRAASYLTPKGTKK